MKTSPFSVVMAYTLQLLNYLIDMTQRMGKRCQQ
jgi:hypothetical protein